LTPVPLGASPLPPVPLGASPLPPVPLGASPLPWVPVVNPCPLFFAFNVTGLLLLLLLLLLYVLCVLCVLCVLSELCVEGPGPWRSRFSCNFCSCCVGC
jgi:hypothetical protein